MSLENPFHNLVLGDLMQSALPDFILGFAFFTALAYAVLSKRFNQQRPAVAMSAALGLALSLGLVWWEQRTGLSVRNLGPIAVGFAVIILATVMYQAVRQAGGTWSGIGIALGVSLFVWLLLGLAGSHNSQAIQAVAIVALLVGLLAFLLHRGTHSGASYRGAVSLPAIRQGTREKKDYQQRQIVSDLLGKRLRDAEQKVDLLHEHPKDAEDIMLQLKRMLPAEGWLTERLARLRGQAYCVRQGHVARIEEIQHLIQKLPPKAKREAAEELVASYKELRLDLRLERLDGAVAANERRIHDLTQQAQACLAAYDYRELLAVLEKAQQLQKHNSRLFKIINHAESRLASIAKTVARKYAGVTGG
jgi:hypothetical protein